MYKILYPSSVSMPYMEEKDIRPDPVLVPVYFMVKRDSDTDTAAVGSRDRFRYCHEERHHKKGRQKFTILQNSINLQFEQKT